MRRLQSIFPLVMIPLALPLARAERTERVRQNAEEQKSLRTTLRDAAGYNSFRLLVLGFFVCGLFVFFVATHLPAYCEDELGAEAGAEIGSWSMSAIGAANVVGSYTMPFLASKWPHRKQHLLALLYAGRSAAMVVFILVPTTKLSVVLFAFVTGFLWLGTVPLTNALVVDMFGGTYVTSLFGIAFASHQVRPSCPRFRTLRVPRI